MAMEANLELQQLEVTALKSIYADDFLEAPPKAWKGAAKLQEFIIRVPHPDPQHATKISFNLHVIFPKTYPTHAYPTFTIQQPVKGLTQEQVTRLTQAIHAQVKQYPGEEMVFQIVTFAQDWLATNVKPPVEAVGSLATEMIKRAMDEERARQARVEAEEAKEAERARQLAEAFSMQLQQRERETVQARARALSDATEVPTAAASDDMLTQTFDSEIEVAGLHFSVVRLFHPRNECLGTMYLADPICDDANATLPLELHMVTFDAPYYSTHQGKKKLRQLESEVTRLTTLRHVNLLSVYAVKLTMPHSGSAPPQLAILMEQRPAVSLKDVLEDCEALREDRASDYLGQILSALNIIHSRDLVHRGLAAHVVGLANREPAGQSKQVKLGKVAYYVKLLDLHRSNPFGNDTTPLADYLPIPDSWAAKDALDSTLIYTRSRDIHCVGVIFVQMLLGLDVMERFPDAQAALRSSTISPVLQRHAMNMLAPKKNNVSCLTILADLHGSPIRTKTHSAPIPIADSRTPMQNNHYGSSPEIDYFRAPAMRTRHASRWKEDWEELELLGRGAFGSVVKARNKIDGRIYAVKKVRLRATKVDNKIFREVNALSRLSHRFIVRYYTTWVELSEPTSTSVSSDDTDSDAGGHTDSTADGRNRLRSRSSGDPFSIDLDDLNNDGDSRASSFPSIHFTGSGGAETEGSDGDLDSDEQQGFDGLFVRDRRGDAVMDVLPRTPPPPALRTLYIQMEFVERQTLKERIAEGLSEQEGWRLFQEIVEALVHMSSLGILHRDIKLTNIFIDGRGDCKVGDFGLATSSLAAVDPTDVSPSAATLEADLTLEVGTRLYIAPEVQSKKKGPRNHTKADMYSLGIVFFEMNYSFSTGAERIAVIEDLRKPEIFFPGDWDPTRTRQRQIITWLLQHDPAHRPTALELSQSNLMPPRLEDEYFKGALKMMSKPDSPHHQAVLAALFSQTSKGVRGLLYDMELELPEHVSLNGIVRDTLATIFRLHGAVEMEPPLLMPAVDFGDNNKRALFLDRHGEVVSLPDNALIPFARLAARSNTRRIKRFHIGDTYRANSVAGHPLVSKAAVFDIITVDIANGSSASSSEAIILMNECLNSFPTLSQHYEIHISHSKIVDLALERIPSELRDFVVDTLSQTRSSWAQKRSLLLKRGLLRSTVDELEVMEDVEEDFEVLLARLEKVSPHFTSVISSAVEDIKRTVKYANAAGVTRAIYLHPLMISQCSDYFKDGVCFEVVRRNKRNDILAVGGRYDHVIAEFAPPKPKSEAICAVGLQISLEKILVALATFQAVSVKSLLKEQRSFGYWSPRRCDVFVVSYQPGQLSERLEVAALLWRHNISADVMYESGLPDGEHENHYDLCNREGILFSVYPRPRSARRDQPAFRVKSILKGTEYDISRQELVPWLQQQIAEQKRIDASTSGAPVLSETSQGASSSKDQAGAPEVHLILPVDAKKQRKQTKQIFLDRAFETGAKIKSAFVSGIPTIAIDVPPATFDAMSKSSTWVTEDEAWKAIAMTFPTQSAGYASQVRESIAKRRAEGHRFILLFAVREERAHLMTLS
ncbi:Serine/threonine-protein kinase [Dentipellis sp. KUC8613]|nr:Serine/threonine-protein kinase [Dentipellis sp. KUC8613]